jgi:hypothetical protein
MCSSLQARDGQPAQPSSPACWRDLLRLARLIQVPAQLPAHRRGRSPDLHSDLTHAEPVSAQIGDHHPGRRRQVPRRTWWVRSRPHGWIVHWLAGSVKDGAPEPPTYPGFLVDPHQSGCLSVAHPLTDHRMNRSRFSVSAAPGWCPSTRSRSRIATSTDPYVATLGGIRPMWVCGRPGPTIGLRQRTEAKADWSV